MLSSGSMEVGARAVLVLRLLDVVAYLAHHDIVRVGASEDVLVHWG